MRYEIPPDLVISGSLGITRLVSMVGNITGVLIVRHCHLVRRTERLQNFELWVGGEEDSQGELHPPRKIGEQRSTTLKKATVKWIKITEGNLDFYDPETNSYWDTRIYASEKDALAEVD